MAIAKRIELLLIDPNGDFYEVEGKMRSGIDDLERKYGVIVHKDELETIDFIWDEERPYNMSGSTYEEVLTAVRNDRRPEPGRRCRMKTINGQCPIFNKPCIECKSSECEYVQKAYKQGRNEAKHFGYARKDEEDGL